MKTLFLALLFVTSAQAATVAQLTIPSSVPRGYPVHTHCIGETFNADDSVNGFCTSTTAGPTSGRAGHPTYTSLVYATIWDVSGNPLADTYCGKYMYNLPYIHIWTYVPGFDASTCYLPTYGTQVSLFWPPLGYDIWLSYITTSADGAYELVIWGLDGYIYGL